MNVIRFQNTDRRDVLRIRDTTFAGMSLNRFIWQPCTQVESLETDCFKYVFRGDAIRGYVAAYRLDDTHFRLNLLVDPDHVNQGIGTRLLNKIEATTKKINGRYLQARVFERMESSLRFARARGFTEIHRMRGMSLSKPDFSFERWVELGRWLSPKGFVATTLKEELEANKNPIKKLARLHRDSQTGWPSPDPTWKENSPIESLEWRFADISFPDRFTIISLKDEYVGYTSAKNKATATAVHPNYRGIGLATYIKALDLKKCIADGDEYFESATANPAMQRVNEKLGYKFNGLCEVRFVKELV